MVLYQIFSKGFLNGKRNMGGASPQRGVAPPNNFCLSLLIHAQGTPLW